MALLASLGDLCGFWGQGLAASTLPRSSHHRRPLCLACWGEFRQSMSLWAGRLLRAGICCPNGHSQTFDTQTFLLPRTPALSPQPTSVFPTQEKPRTSLRILRLPCLTTELVAQGRLSWPVTDQVSVLGSLPQVVATGQWG